MPENGYFLFDAARAENNLNKALELSLVHRSFFKGRSEEELAAVAPYLLKIDGNSPLANWIIDEGWGKSWGILLFSVADFEDVYAHFRRFLQVKTEYGKLLYFRFYDPRVLRMFLASCDWEQVLEFFGSVQCFYVEGEHDLEAVQYWQENGILRQQKTDVSQLVY
jgi:hypothetical protein